MQQAVRAAKVDKRAEIGHVLHNAVGHVAGLDSGEQLLLHLGLLSNQKGLAVADDSSSLGVEFGDDELNVLSGILGQVFLVAVGNQACGDEYPCAFHFHAEAAVQNLGNLRGQHFLVLKRLLKTAVASVGSHTLIG